MQQFADVISEFLCGSEQAIAVVKAKAILRERIMEDFMFVGWIGLKWIGLNEIDV